MSRFGGKYGQALTFRASVESEAVAPCFSFSISNSFEFLPNQMHGFDGITLIYFVE